MLLSLCLVHILPLPILLRQRDPGVLAANRCRSGRAKCTNERRATTAFRRLDSSQIIKFILLSCVPQCHCALEIGTGSSFAWHVQSVSVPLSVSRFFQDCHTSQFVGTCSGAPEPTVQHAEVNTCRRVCEKREQHFLSSRQIPPRIFFVRNKTEQITCTRFRAQAKRELRNERGCQRTWSVTMHLGDDPVAFIVAAKSFCGLLVRVTLSFPRATANRWRRGI